MTSREPTDGAGTTVSQWMSLRCEDQGRTGRKGGEQLEWWQGFGTVGEMVTGRGRGGVLCDDEASSNAENPFYCFGDSDDLGRVQTRGANLETSTGRSRNDWVVEDYAVPVSRHPSYTTPSTTPYTYRSQSASPSSPIETSQLLQTPSSPDEDAYASNSGTKVLRFDHHRPNYEVGVGAHFDRVVTAGGGAEVRVVRLLEKSPAALSGGLKLGDVLLSVNEQSVRGKAMCDLAKLVLGAEGSKVKLELTRKGTEGKFDVLLTRVRVAEETRL